VTISGRIWSAARWPAGWTVHHVDETGSTNADLLAAHERGEAGERTVLATDHQTAGRGRLDRRWDAPPGSNLLVSILFERVPDVPVELTQRVGLAAVAAARLATGEQAGEPIGLKWPNDLLVGDRKLAGILAQRAPDGAVVVGLGLNVGWAPEGAARLGDGVRPAQVLADLLAGYDALPDDIGPRYRRELATLGRRVRIELPGRVTVQGIAEDVDRQGRLVVRDDGGATHPFDVGDVVHVRRAAR
jgi:BirA family biotin operon repressor/biotin-[acetyl-CoA-carboxylase] ligase